MDMVLLADNFKTGGNNYGSEKNCFNFSPGCASQVDILAGIK